MFYLGIRRILPVGARVSPVRLLKVHEHQHLQGEGVGIVCGRLDIDIDLLVISRFRTVLSQSRTVLSESRIGVYPLGRGWRQQTQCSGRRGTSCSVGEICVGSWWFQLRRGNKCQPCTLLAKCIVDMAAVKRRGQGFQGGRTCSGVVAL